MTELYLLTPPRVGADFEALLSRTLAAGRVAALQIRLKDHAPDEIRALAPGLVAAARAHGATVMLNDDPQLAAELGCDGVHIGQEDASYAQARAAMGPKGIVGVTCHDSRHLAMVAGERGADYVAFGSMFPTATKTPKTSAPLSLISWWRELFEIPCVAIGGITTETAPEVIAAGADYIAVCAGVWSHPKGPEYACAAFSRLLD
ncbi:thiamine phosphate synthase [Alkalicaulis satelles]|uniref:Thiamine-phosphate synthase n=1 Tax=Alkalicaulis satelles TaxID=2609175 RepID=A0A5M6ZK78_9PROT|nr:thiamine phosphate synthase [Alkalicaulis satelles]KAA5803628.1 thiamine phosphate synthase [Alkalicaulis satelles]